MTVASRGRDSLSIRLYGSAAESKLREESPYINHHPYNICTYVIYIHSQYTYYFMFLSFFCQLPSKQMSIGSTRFHSDSHPVCVGLFKLKGIEGHALTLATALLSASLGLYTKFNLLTNKFKQTRCDVDYILRSALFWLYHMEHRT